MSCPLFLKVNETMLTELVVKMLLFGETVQLVTSSP